MSTDTTSAAQAALLELAVAQMESARRYTLQLLEGLLPDQWFWTPAAPTTHIAWQVGHLAVAEYGLMLFRQRGRAEIDANLMTGEFRKLFMKGTNPEAKPAYYPSPAVILETLATVHQQAVLEARTFDPSSLSAASDPPHAGPPNRLGSLLFAAHHEMIHAGQIGLLRRMQGLPPVR